MGDDVCICHSAVASEYLKIMDALGVKVGLHKSLVSTGKRVGKIRLLASEFIKRTYFSPKKNSDKLYYDVSALPITQWYMATKVLSSAIDLSKKLDLSLAQYLSLFGFGYRVKARLMANLATMSRRCRHRVLAYYSPYGVKPRSITEWISMRSIVSNYEATPRKIRTIMVNEVREDTRRLLQSLESPS